MFDFSEYKVRYEFETVTKNTLVDPKGCTSISFENIGATSATLQGQITLTAGGAPVAFNNLPGMKIVQQWQVAFAASGSVLVVRTFTEKRA